MAPAADWDTLTPTDGTPGNAYEYGIDVKIGAAWVNIPDITALNPTFTPRSRRRATYAAKGTNRSNTYARDLSVALNVEVVRDELDQYQAELQYLLDVSALLNEDNRAEFRVFDTLGADWAWEFEASVEQGRPQTGDEDPGWFGFTLASYGEPTKIPNPVSEGIDPGVISAVPSGAAAGEAIFISGLAFTGATAVTIGGIAATDFDVIDDRQIRAVVPAGSAGSAPIIVTTAAGASAPLAYTRGA